MYKEKRSRIRSSHPLLTGICLAFVLLYGCGEEAAPASAPSGQEAVTENAAEQREKELSERRERQACRWMNCRTMPWMWIWFTTRR